MPYWIHFCGVPTVADDVTLIASDPHDLQTMLSIQMDHVNKHRYIISVQKSGIKHNVHEL